GSDADVSDGAVDQIALGARVRRDESGAYRKNEDLDEPCGFLRHGAGLCKPRTMVETRGSIALAAALLPTNRDQPCRYINGRRNTTTFSTSGVAGEVRNDRCIPGSSG